MIERTEAARRGDERTALLEFLAYHRATLLQKAEGLDEEQARQTLGPSELSLIGLVRHMAEVERGWFLRCFRGEPVGFLWCDEDDPDRDFHPGPEDTLDAAIAAYKEECARADAIVASASFDDDVEWRGKHTSLRWIVLHMIEETARHNGHADLIRESIDGVVGE